MADNKKTAESSEFDVRDYLRLSFELVNSKLASIDDKATKTEASVQGVIRTINQMQITDATHYINCPNTVTSALLDKKIDTEVQKLSVRLSEFEFLKRYWKVFAIGASVMICGMMITGWVAYGKIEELIINHNASKNPQTNELPKEQFPKLDHTTTYNNSIHSTLR